jgi:hypothetical protein
MLMGVKRKTWKMHNKLYKHLHHCICHGSQEKTGHRPHRRGHHARDKPAQAERVGHVFRRSQADIEITLPEENKKK